MPEGMITATNASATVTVNVTVLPWGTREFALDVEDISVQNLSSNLAVSYASAEIEVRVQAAEKELEELTGSQITASIDLNGMTEGGLYGSGEYFSAGGIRAGGQRPGIHSAESDAGYLAVTEETLSKKE